MKITIYTITDCKFSQAEKQYLQSKQLQFEEKNLEANREFLTEMLNISNNFAGTPVTKIEKDDGQIIVLKGFTQDEFDKAIVAVPVATPNQTITAEIPTEKPIEAQAPVTDAVPPPVMPLATETPVNPVDAQAQPAPSMYQAPVAPAEPIAQAPVAEVPYQPVPQPQQQEPQQQPVQQQYQPPSPPQPVMQAPQPPQQPQMQQQQMQQQPMQSPPPPADNQALNSVLQNLQSRSGDTT